jgi:hypothetical protein
MCVNAFVTVNVLSNPATPLLDLLNGIPVSTKAANTPLHHDPTIMERAQAAASKYIPPLLFGYVVRSTPLAA